MIRYTLEQLEQELEEKKKQIEEIKRIRKPIQERMDYLKRRICTIKYLKKKASNI